MIRVPVGPADLPATPGRGADLGRWPGRRITAVLWGLLRLRTAASLALALALAPMFLGLVQVGNVQPLVVVMLAFGISRRSGPLWSR